MSPHFHLKLLHVLSLFRHERYLGLWAEDMKCGPGMVVTSSGTYCEAIFANGSISVSLLLKLNCRKLKLSEKQRGDSVWEA